MNEPTIKKEIKLVGLSWRKHIKVSVAVMLGCSPSLMLPPIVAAALLAVVGARPLASWEGCPSLWEDGGAPCLVSGKTSRGS